MQLSCLLDVLYLKNSFYEILIHETISRVGLIKQASAMLIEDKQQPDHNEIRSCSSLRYCLLLSNNYSSPQQV